MTLWLIIKEMVIICIKLCCRKLDPPSVSMLFLRKLGNTYCTARKRVSVCTEAFPARETRFLKTEMRFWYGWCPYYAFPRTKMPLNTLKHIFF